MSKNKIRNEQLGMPIGTASARLKKIIMFDLIKKLNQNICFQCGKIIETEENLSIEHKIPYLHSEDPIKLFFDLGNIAFSHLKCNVGAARKNIEALKNTFKDKCLKGQHSNSNLNKELVLEIRNFLKTNKQIDAVKKYNLSKFTISRIVRGESYSYL